MSLFGRKKPSKSLGEEMRDTLYGDLAEWGKPGDTNPPWSLFAQAQQAIKQRNTPQAIQLWQQVLAHPNLESRHYLQAWKFLRDHNANPPTELAKLVYGVVVEVAMEQGLDVLAAYKDGTVRFYHFSGSALVWEHPDNRLDDATARLLDAGQTVALLIGPWDNPGAHPPPPPTGQARLSMLTPSGLHFGQGPIEGLRADPMGRNLFDSATLLMQRVLELMPKK